MSATVTVNVAWAALRAVSTAVQVTEVARDVEGHDLARALDKRFESKGEALDYQTAFCWSVPFQNDRLTVAITHHARRCVL